MGRQLVEIQSGKVQLGETQLAETRWKRQSAGERNAAGGGREGRKAERGTERAEGQQQDRPPAPLQQEAEEAQKVSHSSIDSGVSEALSSLDTPRANRK